LLSSSVSGAGLACAVPFLRGIDGLMGLVIIGLGVYEAWKLTAAKPLNIVGPIELAPPALAESQSA
jgi:hypothetical protein